MSSYAHLACKTPYITAWMKPTTNVSENHGSGAVALWCRNRRASENNPILHALLQRNSMIKFARIDINDINGSVQSWPAWLNSSFTLWDISDNTNVGRASSDVRVGDSRRVQQSKLTSSQESWRSRRVESGLGLFYALRSRIVSLER